MYRLLPIVALLFSCNYIASFDLRDRPDGSPDGDADSDSDADFDFDPDVETDADRETQSDSDPEGDVDLDEEADFEADSEATLDADLVGTGCDGGEDADADCEPQCDGRVCGPDSCGGWCSPGCEERETCTGLGSCIRRWIQVEAGRFEMGSPPGEYGREYRDGGDETLHTVELTHVFHILSTEVTQGMYFDAVGENPSHNRGGGCEPPHIDHPVENVSWHDAAYYCNMLSRRAGLAECYECTGPGGGCLFVGDDPYSCRGYRLPTEAEWEYAARAGTSTATYAGDVVADRTCVHEQPGLRPIAWYACNADGVTQAVGELRRNDWLLYDMLGNVFEWVHDWAAPYPDDPLVTTIDPAGPASGTFRVARGGSVSLGVERNRAAYRSVTSPPEDTNPALGFRVARTIH